MSATSVRFLFLVTFRAVRHYILNFLAKKEAVRNCMLRPRQGNWRLKCAAVQDRALKLYPADGKPGQGVRFGYALFYLYLYTLAVSPSLGG